MTLRAHQKTGNAFSHTLDRYDTHKKANEDHLHEEAKTPTNERMFLMETKVNKLRKSRTNLSTLFTKPENTANVSSSGSTVSSFSSGYGSVAMVSAHQAMKCQNAITKFPLI